jgi:hypothetical protein
MKHLEKEQLFQLSLYHKGALPLEELTSFEQELYQHLSHCLFCQTQQEQFLQKYSQLSLLLAEIPPPTSPLALQTFHALTLKKAKRAKTSRKILQLFSLSPVSRTFVLSAALVFLFFQIFLPTWTHAQSVASTEMCQGHLKALYNAVSVYIKTQKKYPPTDRTGFLTALYKSDVLKDPQAFLCPGADCLHYLPWDIPKWSETKADPSFIEKERLSALGYEGRYYPIHPQAPKPIYPDYLG